MRKINIISSAIFLICTLISTQCLSLKLFDRLAFGNYELFVGGTNNITQQNLKEDLTGDFSFVITIVSKMSFSIVKYKGIISGNFITNDEWIKLKLQDSFGDKVTKIRMLPNGVNVNLVDQEAVQLVFTLLQDEMPLELIHLIRKHFELT